MRAVWGDSDLRDDDDVARFNAGPPYLGPGSITTLCVAKCNLPRAGCSG